MPALKRSLTFSGTQAHASASHVWGLLCSLLQLGRVIHSLLSSQVNSSLQPKPVLSSLERYAHHLISIRLWVIGEVSFRPSLTGMQLEPVDITLLPRMDDPGHWNSIFLEGGKTYWREQGRRHQKSCQVSFPNALWKLIISRLQTVWSDDPLDYTRDLFLACII